jgi:L-iditol 2-dehydrogenase
MKGVEFDLRDPAAAYVFGFVQADGHHHADRELTVSGTSGASPAQNARALDLISSGAVPVTDLITHRFPVAEFAGALAAITSGGAIKVTIEP